MSFTQKDASDSKKSKIAIPQSFVKLAVGKAFRALESAMPHTAKQQIDSLGIRRIAGSSSDSTEEIRRLMDENAALMGEVNMWKGRYRALQSLCEHMERGAKITPEVPSRQMELFAAANPSLRKRSMVSSSDATPANLCLSPPLRPSSPPLAQAGNDERGGELHGSFHLAPASQELFTEECGRSDQGCLVGRNLSGISSSTFQDAISEYDEDMGNERLLEHLVLYGVSGNTAHAMWADALSSGDSTSSSSCVASCIPEQLWCYPSVPEVRELEQFAFPYQVPVQLETNDSWRHLLAEEVDEHEVSGGVFLKVLQRRSPGVCSEEERDLRDLTEGEEAGIDKLIFVLSTRKEGGTPLYGVCMYWDEPCQLLSVAPGCSPAEPVRPPGRGANSSGRMGAVGRLQLLKARRCLCLLSRYPLFEMHSTFLKFLIEDRAKAVTRRLQEMFAGRLEIDGEDKRSSGFGVKDWLQLGNAPSSRAFAAITSLYEHPVPVLDVIPCTINISGLSIALPYARSTADWAEISARDYGARIIFGYLSIPTILLVVSALLLERRVVVQCSDPFILSAVAIALPWLLRPYKWQTHFIPFLPPTLMDFLLAPVPFLAGVLSAPPGGYEQDHVVLEVEKDRVLGGDSIPRHSQLAEVNAKLAPVHEFVSCWGRKPWKRQVRAREPRVNQEVVQGMLSVLSSAIGGLASLLEIRGHCIAGRDMVSGEVLTKETKLSYLRTVAVKDRAFISEFLDTQLFASFVISQISESWLTQENAKINGEQRQLEGQLEESRRMKEMAELLISKQRLIAREQDMQLQLQRKDEEILEMQRRIEALMGGKREEEKEEGREEVGGVKEEEVMNGGREESRAREEEGDGRKGEEQEQEQEQEQEGQGQEQDRGAGELRQREERWGADRGSLNGWKEEANRRDVRVEQRFTIFSSPSPES